LDTRSNSAYSDRIETQTPLFSSFFFFSFFFSNGRMEKKKTSFRMSEKKKKRKESGGDGDETKSIQADVIHVKCYSCGAVNEALKAATGTIACYQCGKSSALAKKQKKKPTNWTKILTLGLASSPSSSAETRVTVSRSHSMEESALKKEAVASPKRKAAPPAVRVDAVTRVVHDTQERSRRISDAGLPKLQQRQRSIEREQEDSVAVGAAAKSMNTLLLSPSPPVVVGGGGDASKKGHRRSESSVAGEWWRSLTSMTNSFTSSPHGSDDDGDGDDDNVHDDVDDVDDGDDANKESAPFPGIRLQCSDCDEVEDRRDADVGDSNDDDNEHPLERLRSSSSLPSLNVLAAANADRQSTRRCNWQALDESLLWLVFEALGGADRCSAIATCWRWFAVLRRMQVAERVARPWRIDDDDCLVSNEVSVLVDDAAASLDALSHISGRFAKASVLPLDASLLFGGGRQQVALVLCRDVDNEDANVQQARVHFYERLLRPTLDVLCGLESIGQHVVVGDQQRTVPSFNDLLPLRELSIRVYATRHGAMVEAILSRLAQLGASIYTIKGYD
jgi:ribosomal protein S27E